MRTQRPWPVASRLAQTPLPTAAFVTGTALMGLALVGARIEPLALVMVLSLTYASYAIDRMVDQRADQRARAEAGVSTALPASAAAAFVLALGLAYALDGLHSVAIALCFPVAVAGYCMRWLGPLAVLRRRGLERIKDIPYAKNVYTATFTTLACVWVAGVCGARPSPSSLVMAGALFLANLINTVACDLGDVEADRADGVPTFPVLLGRARTARALERLTQVWAAILILAATAGALQPCALIAACGAITKLAYLRRLADDAADPLVAKLAPDLTDAGLGWLTLTAGLAMGGA